MDEQALYRHLHIHLQVCYPLFPDSALPMSLFAGETSHGVFTTAKGGTFSVRCVARKAFGGIMNLRVDIMDTPSSPRFHTAQ